MSDEIKDETENFIATSSDNELSTPPQEEKSEEQEEPTDIESKEVEKSEDSEKPKKKPRSQKRIEALSAERNKANERIAELEAKLADNESDINPDSFDTYEEYEKALSNSKPKIQEVDTEYNETLEELQSKFDDGAEKFDDFDEKIQNQDLQITKTMVMAFNDIENSVDTAYYYASNVEEALKVSKMSNAKQLLTIIKKSAELQKKPSKKTTSAPEPIEPVGGDAEYEKSESEMSFSEFEQKRNRETGGKKFW